MRHTIAAAAVAALLACLAAPLAAQHAAGQHDGDEPTASGTPIAPRLSGLDAHHVPISTKKPEAQRFFDQGLLLAYGFNHAEAERSFREAARLDPECAICWWGAAWALGTNYNVAMQDEAVPVAWEHLQHALALAPKASEKERAYIAALAERYTPEAVPDRGRYERAYSDAMGEVMRRFPDDVDAAVIFAESRMNLIPWDLWTPEGEPRPETAEAIPALESVLERSPRHPQALHLYVHAMEKVSPERAEEAADGLRGLVPGAGHLVHMPSHIYQRVGRYEDSLAVNREADRSDEAYVAQCHAQGIYPLAYHSHNVHFIFAAAAMSGRSEEAIAAARKLSERHDEHGELMRQPDLLMLQSYYSVPFQALVRFGKWEEILAEPQPEADLPYTQAMYRYARGIAFVRRGDLAAAEAELAPLSALADDPVMDEMTIFGLNSFRHVFEIARGVLAGELAAARGDVDAAVAHLEQAVENEDDLIYQEPADWFQPVRQSLGAVLLAAGRVAEAEAVYRRDLEVNPENGWSLYGLARALKAQGRDAAEVEARFQAAWRHADIEITGSRL